jgi:low affinity Fe/Cu permease
MIEQVFSAYIGIGIALALIGIFCGIWESCQNYDVSNYRPPLKSWLFWVLVVCLAIPVVNILMILFVGYLLLREHHTKESNGFMDSVFDTSWYDHSHAPHESDWGDHE